MQVKKDLEPNYFYLTVEKLEEYEQEIGERLSFGNVMLITANYLKMKGDIPKSSLLEITDRDCYNAICRYYEREKSINNK